MKARSINKDITYKIDSGRFFSRKKSTDNWTEASKLLMEAAKDPKNKKGVAFLEVYQDDNIIGIFKVTKDSKPEKPIIKTGLKYEEVFKEAMKLNACACSNNSIIAFFVDKSISKRALNFRKNSALFLDSDSKGRVYNSQYFISYVDENEVEKLEKQVANQPKTEGDADITPKVIIRKRN